MLIIIANTVFAEWTKVTTTYQSTGYADLKSIHKNGDIASMDTLIDYEKVPFDGNNLPYRSLKMKSEYNCATRQFRTLILDSYTGNMATGQRPYKSTEPDEWQPVLPRYTQDALWEVACRKR